MVDRKILMGFMEAIFLFLKDKMRVVGYSRGTENLYSETDDTGKQEPLDRAYR